jgi:hypothetical protein
MDVKISVAIIYTKLFSFFLIGSASPDTILQVLQRDIVMRRLCFILLLLTFVLPAPAQQRYDLIISEIMADPSPSVGLPAYEWVELYNRSDRPIDLAGTRISDATGTSNALPSYQLAPGAYLLVGSSSAAAALRVYGNAIGVTSFPSLDNDGDLVMIKNAAGLTLHAVQYDLSWYGSSLKKEGGWTLEIIDLDKPCLGKNNWTASTSSLGGTPGQSNAVRDVTTDNSPPQVLWSIATGADQLLVRFDKTLDSLRAGITDHYIVDGFATIRVEILPPLFDQATVYLDGTMEEGKTYHLRIKDISDCAGNRLIQQDIRTGKAATIEKGSIVINEILFNPRPGAQDYVELYNNGDRIADISELYLANRNSSSQPANMVKLSAANRPFFPGDYYVFTTDAEALERLYTVRNKNAVVQLTSLPSYPNDKGTVLLMDRQGNILEELSYEEKWHFALLNDYKGVALERISPGRPAEEAGNWHSAAATAGHGTPGYINSQYRSIGSDGAAQITLDTEIFSPDQDGWQDLLHICYRLPEPGYIGNVYIFDGSGVRIRHLVRNEIMGTSGCWKWDGLDQGMRPLPVGQYVLYVEWFDLKGRKQRSRKVVVLARKLK